MDTAAAPRKRFDVVAYLKLFRFPLVFTAIADSAAGYLLAGAPGQRWLHFALLALCSGGLYFFGMALNDIADRRRDKEIAPGRVIPSGRIALRSAFVAVALCLAVSLGALLALDRTPVLQRLLFWGAVVLGIVAYDLFLKIPPVMGLVRAFNLLLGLSVALWVTQVPLSQRWTFGAVALPALAYVSGLTYVSTLEDAALDRRKLWVGVAVMAVGILMAGIGVRVLVESQYTVYTNVAGEIDRITQESFRHWHGMIFASILAAWIVRRAWSARDKKGVMLFVRDGVAGIIFLDAALLGSFEGLLPGLCIAALVIPAAISVAVFKRLA